MIRTIIFDLGKVIIPFDFRIGYRQLEGICGTPAADIPAVIRGTGLVPLFETGLIEPRPFVQQLARSLNVEISFEQFREIWNSVFLPETLVSEALLEALAARYRLVLLSNTNALHYEMIERNYPLLRHFHARVLSYEVRAMKPAPEIYRSAITAAGCAPQECFFTDDIAEYVEGARSAGIDAVQFESSAQIERELRARGVCW
jgi:putative hydrolase of the HAD superfamily